MELEKSTNNISLFKTKQTNKTNKKRTKKKTIKLGKLHINRRYLVYNEVKGAGP